MHRVKISGGNVRVENVRIPKNAEKVGGIDLSNNILLALILLQSIKGTYTCTYILTYN